MSETEQDPYSKGLDTTRPNGQRLHAVQLHSNRLVMQRGSVATAYGNSDQTEYASLVCEATYFGYGNKKLSILPDVSLELIELAPNSHGGNLPALKIVMSGKGKVEISCGQATECTRAIEELAAKPQQSKSTLALLSLASDYVAAAQHDDHDFTESLLSLSTSDGHSIYETIQAATLENGKTRTVSRNFAATVGMFTTVLIDKTTVIGPAGGMSTMSVRHNDFLEAVTYGYTATTSGDHHFSYVSANPYRMIVEQPIAVMYNATDILLDSVASLTLQTM
ncbi:MAG: hypothetical protein ABI221_02710 [Candidatus Saccharimonadales bacterium]